MAQLGKISSDKIIYALLFLLPIFAVTVRHWVSNIFALLALLSLVLLLLQKTNHRTELRKEEKILLWGFAAYFGVFILTSVVNGWGPLQTRYTGVEIRFLLFIPFYLVIRQMEGAAKWLLIGAIFGVVFTAYDGAREVLLNHANVYSGVYSPLFTGPVILLLAAILIPYFYGKTHKFWWKLSLLLLACLAFFVVAQTGARNGYFAAIVLGLLFILHQYKGVKRYTVIGVACLLAYGAYSVVDTIHQRVNTAYQEFTEYAAYKNPAEAVQPLTSVGTRLEMWRVTPIFFKDNPVFGVSRGNYSHGVQKYIKQGRVHPDIGKHGHPHNGFSEAIISKGLLGLFAFLWITVYPLAVLIRDYQNGSRSAIYGILLITGYLVLSLTEASLFIKGNFAAIYVIFLAVLFTYHIQEKQKQRFTSE